MKLKLSTTAAAACLALSLATTGALAASTASVTYTSFSTSATGPTLTFSIADQYQTWATTALQNGGLAAAVENDGYAPSLAANAYVASVTGANAVTYIGSNQTIAALVSTSPTPISSTSNPNYARADANQSDSFTLSAAGSITFTIGYTMNVSAVGGNPIDYYSDALAAFTVSNSSGEYFNPSVTINSYDFAGGAGTFSGVFTATVDLAAGETGYYTLQGTSESFASTITSAVPEPSTWSFSLAGVGVLLMLARRRRSHNDA